MSEYQYYEFLAVDRQLTKAEIAELRAISSRAEITSRSLVNEYTFGSFKGDYRVLLTKYFDAHVYVANWGTHRFVVKVPKAVMDLKEINQYLHKYSFEITETPADVIVEFNSELEEGEGWVETQPWMSSMIGIRDELLKGDLRSLYLGWLTWVCNDYAHLLESAPDEDDDDSDDEYEEDDESSFDEGEGSNELEPPVPPGMGELTAAQQSLAEFLRISDDLLTAVAEASPALKADHDSSTRLVEWIAKLPVNQKDALLLELVQDDPGMVRVKLMSQFRAGELSNSKAEKDGSPRRSITQLLARANHLTRVRLEAAARKKAEEAARKKVETERRREVYLAALANTQEAAWKKVDSLIALRMAKSYAEIAIMLADLREVAVRENKLPAFQKRFEALIEPHLRKSSFMSRLKQAGLR